MSFKNVIRYFSTQKCSYIPYPSCDCPTTRFRLRACGKIEGISPFENSSDLCPIIYCGFVNRYGKRCLRNNDVCFNKMREESSTIYKGEGVYNEDIFVV